MQKRRHDRVRARGVASHLRGSQSFTPGLAVENLSFGGAFVRSPEPLPLGSPVVIDLVRPGLKKSIRVSGRVVSVVAAEEAKARQLVPGMGVQFDAYDFDVETRLGALLTLLTPNLSKPEPRPEAAPAQGPPAQRPPAQRPPPPVLLRVPAPAPPVILVPPDKSAEHEAAKLQGQVKGLFEAFGESQLKLSGLERENAQLRAEVTRLRGELVRLRKT